jgi:CO dehydrogenase/acetyl-CoA synthase alpha subunit
MNKINDLIIELLDLSNFDNIYSAEDMQNNLEEINEKLQTYLSDINMDFKSVPNIRKIEEHLIDEAISDIVLIVNCNDKKDDYKIAKELIKSQFVIINNGDLFLEEWEDNKEIQKEIDKRVKPKDLCFYPS